MENPNAILWIPRQDGDFATPVERYTEENQRFISLTTIHGGKFKRLGGLRYTGDLTSNTFDFIDVGDLSFTFLEKVFRSVGFRGRPFFYYQHPDEDFDYGMIRLKTPAEFSRFQCTIWPKMWKYTPTIYAEADIPTICVSYPRSLLDASRSKMVEILWPCVAKKPHIQAEGAQAMLKKRYGISFPIPMIEAVIDETVVAVWGQRKEDWVLGS